MSWSQQEFSLFQRCTKTLEEISKSLHGIDKSLAILADAVPSRLEVISPSSEENLDDPTD